MLGKVASWITVGLLATLVPACARHTIPAIAPEKPPAESLSWPVPGGMFSSGFGPRGGRMHEGIDIRAPVGTPVHAARAGVVVFCGTRRGYGRMIILRHEPGLTTAYAHNDRNLVRQGQRVARGERIATVGRTGRTDGANLHFEVRRQGFAVDPLPYLASTAQRR